VASDKRAGTSSGDARRARASERRAAMARAQRRRRQVRWGGGAAAVIAVIVAVVVTLLVTSSGGSSTASGNGPAGAEGIALQQGTQLAGLSAAGSGKTVDGIQCSAAEGQVEHIHTHLAVYVDGKLRPLPPGIGIVKPVAQSGPGSPFYSASTCYYWLHVHTQDGVIHVEAPAKGTYTLGQFFAVWGQPLSAGKVAGATGTVTAYVDGKAYTGDPAGITLGSREDVQLDVGTVVAPQPVDWSHSQL
jgi:hypothetical protein